MKNSGFRRLSYDEALARKIELEERKKLRALGARQVETKTKQQDRGAAKLLGEWKDHVRCLCNYQCQYPGCKVRDLHIDCHHVNPRSQRKDLIYVVSNGKCLCANHHAWVHDNPVQAIKMDLLRNRSRELAAKEGTLGVY